jgi:hypothetical protein
MGELQKVNKKETTASRRCGLFHNAINEVAVDVVL